ncbi:hypothetical protein ASF48_08135 [Rathayibacter sp. Leaf299]|uniref:hypothetical protein n=1 Tax=Rathayibacter sp. Leaf299 TaxID=1736328 RepID=UPI0006FEBFE0|nr:hypothetical protein [Rathayibacter sp. Leaf299]KQQ20584.1 hypothetical protein ASF48_08135 [Rathayibacter sp. Leaf299]
MAVTRLTLDGVDYTLAPEIDLDALRSALLDGVSSVGRWVGFPSLNRGLVHALITPSSSVRLEEHPDAPVEFSWEGDQQGYDLDFSYGIS